MPVLRAFSVLASIAVLSGCAARSDADNAPPLKPQRVSWATYQYSPDRNAVLTQYSIPKDWSYDAKGNINGGLALAGNTLLFTTFSHQLVALNVQNGNVLWHAPVMNIAMSTPIVAGNTVYVGTGRNGLLKRDFVQRIRYRGKDVWGVPGGDEIAAFDLRTGARRWTFQTTGEDMPSALYDRGRLIFANGDRHAYALRADTGKPLWITDIGGVATMANAVMAGNAVVFATCSVGHGTYTVALDPATGKMLWRAPYGHCDASPTYASGKVFVNSAQPGNMALEKKTVVTALDARTGKPVWVYRGKAQGLWSIVGSDEVAVAGMHSGNLYYQPAPLLDEIIAFDDATGKIRWQFHTAGPVKMSPVVRNGALYVGDVAGMLYTLNANSGALMEIREFKRPFTTSPPIIAGNKLIIANGTSVDALPLSGRPKIAERVGWGIITDKQAGSEDE